MILEKKIVQKDSLFENEVKPTKPTSQLSLSENKSNDKCGRTDRRTRVNRTIPSSILM